jgi:hypothetical protein
VLPHLDSPTSASVFTAITSRVRGIGITVFITPIAAPSSQETGGSAYDYSVTPGFRPANVEACGRPSACGPKTRSRSSRESW